MALSESFKDESTHWGAATASVKHVCRRATFRLLLVSVALAFCSPSRATADIVILHSGGKIYGKVAKSGKGSSIVTVTMARGGKMTLLKTQVKQIQFQSPPQVSYKSVAPAAGNTVKSQWELAQWCKKWGLKAEREFHLHNILKTKPNHAKARHGLGFTQVKGRWIRHKEFQKEQGYAFYRGSWRLSQEIDLLETKAKRNLAEREWTSRLLRLRKMTSKKARRTTPGFIVSIKDPLAVGPLVRLIHKEKSRFFKALYIDALVNIGNGEAIVSLLKIMLNDPDVEIYYYCLDRVKRIQYPDATIFLSRALKSPQLYKLNRAAHAIQEMGFQSTIPLLIDQLVRTYYFHKSGSDQITTSFGSRQDPFTGEDIPMMGMQPNETAQVYTVRVTNQRVLGALTSLAQVNLGYNIPAWKRWHRIEQKRLGEIELKRRSQTSQRREQGER